MSLFQLIKEKTGLGHCKVFVNIICDKQQTENMQKIHSCQRIRRALYRIKGVKEVYFIEKQNTMDIVAYADWKESEIPEKMKEIKQIAGIKNVTTTILESA